MTTPAETYRLEEQIGFKLRKVHQQASEVFARVMAGYDVTPTQFAALTKLCDEGAVSQNALGRLTAMDPATMSGVVNRLKKRGLLAQSANPQDGRAMLLNLTEEGQRLTLEMRARGALVSADTLKPLKAQEKKRLLALLDRLAGT